MTADIVKNTEQRAGGGASPSRRGSVHPIVPWIVAWACLLPLPFLLTNAYTQYVVNVICINVILAVGLNIVKGFAGQVTVGHMALAAIGAYSSAVLSTKLGLPFWGAMPAAMLVTGLAGAIVGVPSFRLEGAYLALATLGLAEAVRIIISGTDWLGASLGYAGIPPPYLAGIALDDYRSYYYLAMPLALLGLYFAFSILSSDIGRALKALREDPLAAAASGVNVRKYKVTAFVLSALYAGCAGSLQAHMAPGFIHPNSYTITEMITLLLMVVFGGIGHIWGGVIGAIAVTLIDDLTRDYLQYRMVMFGAVIVLTVMFMPSGIGGLIDDVLVRRRFKAIRRRRAGVASVVAADDV
ncbi:MAG: branched-chain amino acid ABC transporter permease [Hyphomicrobiaceae bacterium]|nr:branched-chain amino acid ABC transporter permease [Hyphomicrobiaceae bacterium]